MVDLEFLFSLGWWLCYFIAAIGSSLSNFRYVHKGLKSFRVVGDIGVMLFIFPIVVVILQWGFLATGIFLLYLFLTALFKLKVVYPHFRKSFPKEIISIYDQFMVGRSAIDEKSVKKAMDKEFKKVVSRYIDSLR